jgi:fatty-acyl-CoA synthase
MGILQRINSEYLYVTGLLRTLHRVTAIAKNPTHTYPQVVEELAAKYGDKPAILSDHESLTYREYDRRANRYARWALQNGVEKGEAVCLFMPNRPEYLAIWLGVARAGGVTALINTGLAGASLAHSVNIVKPRHVIVAAELVEAYRSAMPHLEGSPQLWVHGQTEINAPRIDDVVALISDDPLNADERRPLNNDDHCLYIYTSGTTGLPKAANINHYRVQAIMNAFSAVMDAKPSDRMYVCLPMYHSAGGVLAVGSVLTVGGSVYVRDRFSASQFWTDVVESECTLFQYVGELCRYLVNAPSHPLEQKHKLRLACGNGLRPDIWVEFKERFRIPKILEFYAATEGNAVFFNMDGTTGAVGRVPPMLKRRFLLKLIRFDIANEKPMVGPDGFYQECEPEEIGELISEIVDDPLKPSQRFEGYADSSATERKILRNVFKQGDRWFRTGDLMRRDKQGYFYFVDRIGDTFRWKGENVATCEVAETLTSIPGVKEANVYGVKVGNLEGRAGMAALVTGADFSLDEFRRRSREDLPPYAVPLFVRIADHTDLTGTFKMRKFDLVDQGFDPNRVGDPLYFDNPETDRYDKVDMPLFTKIREGQVRI